MSQNHKNVLELLTPVALGDAHGLDLAIEGGVLDTGRDAGDSLAGNIFANTAFELLADWERVLGLAPESSATTTSRVAGCVAKLREHGGSSIPYFEALAADLGYSIEIVEFQPFQAGVSVAGDMIYVDHIIWCWRVDVNTTELPVYYFSAGESGAGDTLLSFIEGELEALITDLKPAHTFVYFAYPWLEWSPAVIAYMPSGVGDLDPIYIASQCNVLEVRNDSPALVTVKLRSASADGISVYPYSTRQIGGPYGAALSSVADYVLLNTSVQVNAGQLIVTELREFG